MVWRRVVLLVLMPLLWAAMGFVVLTDPIDLDLSWRATWIVVGCLGGVGVVLMVWIAWLDRHEPPVASDDHDQQWRWVDDTEANFDDDE